MAWPISEADASTARAEHCQSGALAAAVYALVFVLLTLRYCGAYAPQASGVLLSDHP
ncbi:hypothetical protein [Amphritea sp.]|uniref:hypothetical protein n=1 Tax=Amphritea sp. TaxID=1872502 RepID=UPI003569631B